ncbi:MAG: hypothetical protein MRJ65_17355 [Candidatus Brocadiaceae bacterium]|nr:hypothetical protein [Candidatus Brocadiaceae bacterium]
MKRCIHFLVKTWLMIFLLGILILFNQNNAQAVVEIFVSNPNNTDEIIKLRDASAQPFNPLPVLFIHGHNVDDPDDGGDFGCPRLRDTAF